MKLTVNGEIREVAEGLKLGELLDLYKLKPQGVVVELNLQVPGKNLYAELELHEGDTLEIVKFMGGG
jgi:sulfur carrier protein